MYITKIDSWFSETNINYLEEAKKIYIDYVDETYGHDVLKLAKRGKVIFAVVEDKNTNEIKGQKIMYNTYVRGNETCLSVKIYDENAPELHSKYFNLNELLMLTESDIFGNDSRNMSLNRINRELIDEQYIFISKGLDIPSQRKKIKRGSIIKFEQPIKFVNGEERSVFRYNLNNHFFQLDDVDCSGMCYVIRNFKSFKYEIIE